MSLQNTNNNGSTHFDPTLNRVGERGNVPGRSERFVEDRNEWFFRTREGAVEGPFESRSHAGRGLSEFLEFLAMATPRVPVKKH